MDDLDKVKTILIVALVVLMGLSIYAHWHLATHPDYGMKIGRASCRERV